MSKHFGIIGINDKFEIFEGYDGMVSPDNRGDELSNEVKAELAHYMIVLWNKFLDSLELE